MRMVIEEPCVLHNPALHSCRFCSRRIVEIEEIKWCKVHRSSASSDGWFADKLRCSEWWIGEMTPESPLLDPYDCIMVPKSLIDVVKSAHQVIGSRSANNRTLEDS